MIVSFYLGNMWANINAIGINEQSTHTYNSLWSGVYYIKALQNSGQLKIEDLKGSVALMSRFRQKDVFQVQKDYGENILMSLKQDV